MKKSVFILILATIAFCNTYGQMRLPALIVTDKGVDTTDITKRHVWADTTRSWFIGHLQGRADTSSRADSFLYSGTYLVGPSFLRSDRRDTFTVLRGDTVIAYFMGGHLSGRSDTSSRADSLLYGSSYLAGSSFLRTDRRDTFTTLQGDTSIAFSVGHLQGRADSSTRADSVYYVNSYLYGTSFLRSDRRDTFLTLQGDTVIGHFAGHLQGRADTSSRADSIYYVNSYLTGSSFLRSDRRDTFTTLQGDTINTYSIGHLRGRADTSSRADSVLYGTAYSPGTSFARSTALDTVYDLKISNPCSIYALSHNSFAGYLANEHIDWTNADSKIFLSYYSNIPGTGDYLMQLTYTGTDLAPNGFWYAIRGVTAGVDSGVGIYGSGTAWGGYFTGGNGLHGSKLQIGDSISYITNQKFVRHDTLFEVVNTDTFYMIKK